MQVPDFVGEPVLGWRVWILDEELGLGSIMKNTWWPERRPFRATCISPHRTPEPNPHESPVLGSECPCGIYAVRDPKDTAMYLANFAGMGVPRAIGLVSLWGRIVEGEGGWRAEFAYPRHLYILRNVIRVTHLMGSPQRTPVSRLERPHRLVDAIGLGYGVPVTVLQGGTPADALTQLHAEGAV